MTVQKIPQTSAFSFKIKEIDSAGKEKIVTRKYANVKPEASDADVYAVAYGLVSLQKDQLESIERIDDGKLISA